MPALPGIVTGTRLPLTTSPGTKMEMETQQQNSSRHQKRRMLLIVCVLAPALPLLFIHSDSAAPPNDFAFYWTAARLVLEGKNPYSVADTVDLQHRLFFASDRALVMLNP